MDFSTRVHSTTTSGGAGLDRLAFADEDFAHAPGASRTQLVFHLHRFDDDETLARLDVITGFDEDADDLARHRRDDPLRAGAARRRRLAGPAAEARREAPTGMR